MDEYFDACIDEFGRPTSSKAVDPTYAETYRGKVPDKLIQYWLEYGFCGFRDGLFWIVDPADYEASKNAWISDTDIVDNDTYFVIGRSGYGDLFLWGTKSGDKYTIIPKNGWVLESKGKEKAIKKGEADLELQIWLSFRSIEELDIDIPNGSENYIFSQLVEKHGPLAPDEVFGFEPALFLGGKKALNNINKLNIHVHLSILAQMGHREILDRSALIAKAFGGGE